MPWNRSTASREARGYGAEHKAERKRRLQLHTPTDPCIYCRRPLGQDRSLWHLPHNETRTGYLPGFSCRDCNIKDGSRRGRAKQNRTSETTQLRW